MTIEIGYRFEVVHKSFLFFIPRSKLNLSHISSNFHYLLPFAWLTNDKMKLQRPIRSSNMVAGCLGSTIIGFWTRFWRRGAGFAVETVMRVPLGFTNDSGASVRVVVVSVVLFWVGVLIIFSPD